MAELLEQGRTCSPDQLPGVIAAAARGLGATDAVVYLADYDQRTLVPVPRPGCDVGPAVPVDASVPGRAYRSLQAQHHDGEDDGQRVWWPLVDGSERLGIVRYDLQEGDGGGDVEPFTALVAEVLASKRSHGDLYERVRRRQPMSLTAELAWQLLPPLTSATDRVTITAALTPPYEVGGDSFDYAVDAERARFAIFDGMGHGLESGLLATVAVAAYRHARRSGANLSTTVDVLDAALTEQFGGTRFVTAVLAELELGSGRLRWCVAGHPRPLLLRQGRVVKSLDGVGGTPLGIGFATGDVAEETLEPGDRILLFTDGVIEAKAADGTMFGAERLADFVIKASAAGAPPPETMRRLVQAIVDHQAGRLQDDATTVLVEWAGRRGRDDTTSSGGDEGA